MKKVNEKPKMNKIYKWLMSLGKISGCHQLPDRSFIIKSKQFPVCARCTGVFFGNIVAAVMFFIYRPYWLWFIMGCAVIFTDWFIQYLDILVSTNIRRLITGIIGGYSLTSLYWVAIKILIEKIVF